jgi:hypothetical protein
MDKSKTIDERAADTLQKRLRGSFGYRAAESVVSGYNPVENMTIYKSHGGTKEDLKSSLELVIERNKPQVTAKDISDDLAVDTGEAQAILDEENMHYDEVKKEQANFQVVLDKSFDSAPSKYSELGQFSTDNYKRVIDNLLRSARAQYARSKNATWATAVKGVTDAALVELAKYAPSNEAESDEVAA